MSSTERVRPSAIVPRALSAMGPAVIASIAYMDPGNFATNIQAGAHYRYALVWVVMAANIIAMLFQAMSAKIGIVTGQNLAELCREHFPKPLVWAMWLASEVAAMATDLAEFLGGAVGLALLFRLPLIWGMVATGAVTYGILLASGAGYRQIERVIAGFVAVIAVCYIIELVVQPPDWTALAVGAVLPRLPDADAVTLAVGIIGATVMPHAIYLHSELTQNRAPVRDDGERAALIRWSNAETIVALSVAGLVNLAMVAMAAATFSAGHPEVDRIETAYHTLVPLLGIGAAGVFLLSLLASGVSSSVVGTLAGQVILQGFLKRHIPVWLRRVLTMAPAFAVVALGYDATECLVISQVVLSLVLPVPVVALVVLSRRREVMGRFTTGPVVQVAAVASTAVVLGLNFLLIFQTLNG